MNNIILFFCKIIGRVYIFHAVKYRAEARNVVYNYILQNNKINLLKRLWQRNPVKVDGGWKLSGGPHEGYGIIGYVKYRKITKYQFYKAVFLCWGWLDDDSNQDTTDFGYIESIRNGDRKNDLVGWLYGDHLRALDLSHTKFGNSFDLGDYRANDPFYDKIACKVWNDRNTAMNFQYLFSNY